MARRKKLMIVVGDCLLALAIAGTFGGLFYMMLLMGTGGF